jgi:hypothetical protein
MYAIHVFTLLLRYMQYVTVSVTGTFNSPMILDRRLHGIPRCPRDENPRRVHFCDSINKEFIRI